jgi:hypothetical protein
MRCPTNESGLHPDERSLSVRTSVALTINPKRAPAQLKLHKLQLILTKHAHLSNRPALTIDPGT